MTVGTRSRASISCDEHLEIGGSLIPFQPQVKNLGVFLDSNLIMCEHVSSLSCCLPWVEQNQHHPSIPYWKCDRHSCLFPHIISYCNSLLVGITSEQIARLQRVQNNAAWMVFHQKRSGHVTPLVIKLYWLPIKQHIEYKIATLAFRYFDGTLPPYLRLSISILSSQIPPILLRKSAVCPTYKLKKCRCKTFPLSDIVRRVTQISFTILLLWINFYIYPFSVFIDVSFD